MCFLKVPPIYNLKYFDIVCDAYKEGVFYNNLYRAGMFKKSAH